MRLLLDECVDEHLRHLFSALDCQKARFAGLAGVKNGRLLDAAEAPGFDILITVDQKIPDQQNLVWAKDFNRNSLRDNKPLTRFGTLGARSDLRARFHKTRRRRENSLDAVGSAGREITGMRFPSTWRSRSGKLGFHLDESRYVEQVFEKKALPESDKRRPKARL